MDAWTGLVHLGAREYVPAAGRFLSVDPVMDPSDPQQMGGVCLRQQLPGDLHRPDGKRLYGGTDPRTGM